VRRIAKLSIIGGIATAILFIVGVIMLSIFDVFSENWLIGIGLIAAAIVVIAITIYLKAKA